MLRTLVTFLISPLGAALVLGALALVAGTRGHRRWGWWLFTGAWAWLLLWSSPWASHGLMRQMESSHPPVEPALLPTAQAIVVLGGAVSPPGQGGEPVNLQAAVDRVWFAARAFHAGRAPLVLLSGGADRAVSRTSEAAAMALLMQDLGVPVRALLLEEDGRTTDENASRSAVLLRQRGIGQVLLVTSALHMPRAMTHFQRQGLQVLPAPTDFEARSAGNAPVWERLLPDVGSLDRSGRALKEWVGLRVD